MTAAIPVRGVRASAYTQKLSDDLEIAAIYAWAGALSPGSVLNTTSSDLRDRFMTQQPPQRGGPHFRKNSAMPARSFLQATNGFPAQRSPAWMQFGEAAYQMDPNLHLSIRQPLARIEWALGSIGRFQQPFGARICDGERPGFSNDALSDFAVVPGWGELPVLVVQAY